MRFLIVTIFVVSLSLVVVLGDKQYPTKYDGLDVDKILSNDRILTSYIKCIMGEGSCTTEGRELKKILPDALQTGCSKCNDKQKITAQKVIEHLSTKRSDDWKKLTNKFDPKGEYQKKFEQMAQEEKAKETLAEAEASS
ncbi:ejaculatory bulb-specific protein 3-like [Chrysoperla carnea]|nr:ejaculatory bulb-specific protein 3-like [Chrysoperla carnea]